VLAIYKELSGENDENTANVHGYIGQILKKKKLYKESLVEHRKALGIRRLILGENHRYTALSYECIGSVLFNQGRYDDALIGFGKALTIRIKLFGENHMYAAVTYISVAHVLIKKRQYEETLEKLAKRTQFTDVFQAKIIQELSLLPKILIILRKHTNCTKALKTWEQLRSFG